MPLGPVNPDRPQEITLQFSNNAAFEAIKRHAFNYLPKDFLVWFTFLLIYEFTV